MITRLQIINEMVVSTGTAPIKTGDTRHPLYIKANNKLEVVNESLQTPGFWFNTCSRELRPNVSGEIILPANTLHADPLDRSSKLTIRGGKLYDMEKATYNIGAPIRVRFVEKLQVEELPTLAAKYVAAEAVYQFYLDEDGNEPKLSSYRSAKVAAWVELKGEHLKNADVNFFSGTSAAQMARGTRSRGLPLYDTE